MGIFRTLLRRRARKLEQQKQVLNRRGPLLTSAPLVLANSPAHARHLAARTPFRLFSPDEPLPPGGMMGVESE
jgi:hypothetical protein